MNTGPPGREPAQAGSRSASGSASELGSPSASAVLRVEAVFHGVAAEQAERITAAMIGRAHELANLPECECDVDVNISREGPQGTGIDAGAGAGGARAL